MAISKARSVVAAGLSAALFFGAAHAVAAEPAVFTRFVYAGEAREHLAVRPDQFRNPILPGYYPDPSVTRVGDDYYLVNSSFGHFPGIPVFHSRDLVSWTQIGNAVDRPGQLNLAGRAVSDGVYAPDISWHDGLFYIVNTCVRCGGNFVITARDPAGPWSDPVWLPFEGIDPSLFWDGERAYILNNGAPQDPPAYSGHRAIWIQEFDWRTLTMTGERTQIVNGGVDLSREPSWIEGPHLIKRGGVYILIAAEGGTGPQHSEVAFRASSVEGPYMPASLNPILTQRDLSPSRSNPVTSAGHAKLVETAAGDWWAVFLATRPYAEDAYNTGRETFLAPVEWKEGWPVILAAGRAVPLALNRPDLPSGALSQVTGDFTYTDEFDEAGLGAAWIGVRNPTHPFHRLVGGTLELTAAARLGDVDGVPAFVGRRLQHQAAVISTTVAASVAEEGARAGLAAVQSDQSFLFFGLTRLDGQRTIALYTRDKAAEDHLVAASPVGDAAVELVISVDGGKADFAYEIAGQRTILKSGVDISLLSTSRAGGFVGTVVGPYAWGE
jgi:xylan 1,4-beta-xylosidase